MRIPGHAAWKLEDCVQLVFRPKRHHIYINKTVCVISLTCSRLYLCKFADARRIPCEDAPAALPSARAHRRAQPGAARAAQAALLADRRRVKEQGLLQMAAVRPQGSQEGPQGLVRAAVAGQQAVWQERAPEGVLSEGGRLERGHEGRYQGGLRRVSGA